MPHRVRRDLVTHARVRGGQGTVDQFADFSAGNPLSPSKAMNLRIVCERPYFDQRAVIRALGLS
jgi:hypothetical protein